jgi:hypothetical protein
MGDNGSTGASAAKPLGMWQREQMKLKEIEKQVNFSEEDLDQTLRCASNYIINNEFKLIFD